MGNIKKKTDFSKIKKDIESDLNKDNSKNIKVKNNNYNESDNIKKKTNFAELKENIKTDLNTSNTEKKRKNIDSSDKENIKNSKNPFAGLKSNIMSEMHIEDDTIAKNKKSAKETTSKDNIKNDEAYKKAVALDILKQKTSENPKDKKKIDMAYLKATIQDTLKQGSDKEEKIKDTMDRVPTYIEGFDETIEGGFIRNSITLVCGGPGSGKSIFAMQALVNGIEKEGEHGVYISFEEETETILSDMKRFNWNLQEKMDKKQLAILYYSPEQVDRVIEIGGGPIREIIESTKARRIVIDSVTAFTLLYKTENEQRRALMGLFKTLKKWGCTTILISEQTITQENHVATVEEYQSEGVIMLYNTKKGDTRERSIEIFKMRGTNHSRKINPLKISSDGITVYPDENVY